SRFIQNEGINLREQHDALEFFNKLVDSLDEAAKFLGKGEICSQIFGGTFADQKICKGCPHRYTREEPFNTLSLDVRHHDNLLDSLQEYVKGDLLESENAYFCEKCSKKVDAVKRLCIKKLPRILAIQLKRFDFDWEREVAVKFHDYFQFPREVDMEPYTADGLSKLEGHLSETCEEKANTVYELRGIVIHSGQANGGHYYSCILHSYPDGTKKWYKFDDGEVSECKLDDDEEMKTQCFGGEYSSENFDPYCRRIQKRLCKRWWNAYILFYEKLDATKDVDAAMSNIVNSANSLDIHPKQFKRMSSRLETNVKRKNTKSMHERNQYTPEYFQFMRNMCSANPLILKRIGTRVTPAGDHLLLLSVQMAVKFLLTTGFRAKHNLHCNTLQEWASDVFEPAFRLCPAARHWFAQDVLYRIPTRFSEFLLEAPHP
uniref:USP domain-containing protein n=1 Tax=Romanomermis culicivorax TaxID=13658 RepID=A0A915KA51_ROMCU